MAVSESGQLERSAVCQRHSSIPLDAVCATGRRDSAKDERYFPNALHRSFDSLPGRSPRLVNVLRNRPQAGSFNQCTSVGPCLHSGSRLKELLRELTSEALALTISLTNPSDRP
jgi:hypothetical protein